MNSDRLNKTSRRLDPLDVLVGKRIRTQRLARKMSQSELGKQLGITFQQIQKYESGVNRVGAGRLQSIAKIFELPVERIFRRRQRYAGCQQRNHRNGTQFPEHGARHEAGEAISRG